MSGTLYHDREAPERGSRPLPPPLGEPSHAPAGRGDLWIALAVLAVYLATLTPAHSWDAIAYTARAASDPWLSERYLATRLWHPHHLLYTPAAMLVLRLSRALGFHGDAFLPIQILNAVLGAGCVLLAGRLARNLGASGRERWIAMLLVGFAHATWRYATEVEVMIPAVFLLLLSLVALSRPGRPAWTAAGLAAAGAVLFHQLAVLVVVAILGALARAASRGQLERRGVTRVALAALVPALGVYLLAGLTAAGSSRPTRLLEWALAAGGRATSASHGAPGALRETAHGLASAWVATEPVLALTHGAHGTGDLPRAAGALLALAGLAIATVLAMPGIARAARQGQAVVLGMALGLAATALFVAWFQPWNDDYWVYLPSLAAPLLVAHGPRTGTAARLRLVALGASAVLLVLLSGAWFRRSAGDASYADLLELSRRSFARGDLLVSGSASSPVGEGIVALPFLAGLRVLPAPEGGDEASEEHFARELRAEVATTRARNGAIYVTGGVASRVVPMLPGASARDSGSLRGTPLQRLEWAGR